MQELVGLLRLAVAWMVTWFVLGLWSTAGGSGAASRRHRRERPDLEVEGELGDRPRPARHSDMWAPLVLLLGVRNADLAMELLQSRVCLDSVSLSRRACWRRSRAAVVSWWCRIVQGLRSIFVFLRGLSALCPGLHVLLDRSLMCVRVLYYYVSLT